MAETTTFKSGYASHLTEYKFEHTFIITEYEKMVPYFKNNGALESRHFFIGPKKEVKLKVKFTNVHVQRNGNSNLTPKYIQYPQMSVECGKSDDAPAAWLKEATCSVRKSDGTRTYVNSFPSGQPFHVCGKSVSGISICNLESFYNGYVVKPEDYDIDGSVVFIINGVIATCKSSVEKSKK